MAKNNNLEVFFNPKSIAVIGASNHSGKVGNDIINNVKKNFSGQIFPINPKETEIIGLPAFAQINQLPVVPDLTIIVIPAAAVPAEVEAAAQYGCQNFIIISAGFKETGQAGQDLENQLKQLKEKYHLRILGPNCLGYISSSPKINASFSAIFPKTGNIAFISQSGALGTAILDLAQAQQVGFSYFVSFGNKADINELDLLEYFSDHKKTKVIMVYLENITNGQKFIELCQKITKKKPIIILKAGKTEKGSQAVSSHTGVLAGSSQAYSAAFKQCGVIEADDVEDFFDLAKGLSRQKPPAGNRVAIITNAGGPGVIMTDLLPRFGLEAAELSLEIKEKLKANLPVAANINNPVDILGDALADRYGFALETVLPDDNIDAGIVVLTPQKSTPIKAAAETIGKIAKQINKPVIACFIGGKEVNKFPVVFRKYSLPQYNYPLSAVRALSQMLNYKHWQEEKLAPSAVNQFSGSEQARNSAAQFLAAANLTENIAREILMPFDFPLHQAKMVKTADEAVAFAQSIGYPVALKIVSPQIIHKSDVGGVKVDIKNNEDLKQAIEAMNKKVVQAVPDAKIDGYLVGEMVNGFPIILGVKRDQQFGSLIMLGLGGIYTEVFKDVAFRLAPLSQTEAFKMIRELKVYPLLSGSRGQKPLDINALADLLVKLADFSLLFPQIKEIDFNPVMVLEAGSGCKIVDVRMVK